LDEYESQIDNLLESGDDLIENQKLGARKSQEIKSESKIIQQRWSAIRNQAQVLLNRYEDIATMLNSESDEKADSLLTRIHLFHEWLQLGQQQLDFYKNPEKSITFNELLQREQGLKNLATCSELQLTLKVRTMTNCRRNHSRWLIICSRWKDNGVILLMV